MRVQAVRWRIARRHLNQKKSHRVRWVLAFVLVALISIGGGSGAAAMYFVSHLPSTSKFHIHYTFQNARIFDSRGTMLYNMANLSKQGGRRVVEPLQDLHDQGNACRAGVNRIPLLLQNATIATEDATFYKNPGFDALSILRAAYDDFQHGHVVSGASTITQQVVRASYFDPNDPQYHSLTRKAQEVALAYEISKKYSKRKILWYYLNSVPYGNLAYGAQAAAEVYFGVQACRLDPAQAALLAGLPEAPTSYNPVNHLQKALSRMNAVLSLMYKHGYLQHKWQIGAYLAEASHWRFAPSRPQMRYPQFVRYVVDQIQTMPRIRSQLYNGIDVYTTLDPRLQDLAQQKVTSQIDGLAGQHVTDGALISLDLRAPHYGWILAMIGSAHYSGAAGQINMSVTPRQPGSSMKPFNYIYAFQHGVNPGTQVLDSPLQLPDPYDKLNHGWYGPTNYDHLFHGAVSVREALANSLNVPAVKVEYYVTGADHVAQTAYRFGMKSLYHDNPGLACRVCYSVTLGGLAQGTRLLEETSAYGSFATGGYTVPPVAIWKVVKRNTGQVLFCSADCPRTVKPAPWIAQARKRVLDTAHAYEMTDVLSDNSARCTPHVCEFGPVNPLVLSHPAAAKTGTTNQFTDNWTIGYTSQIVTGVWAGNADRTPMVNVIGITGAAPIWHDYMEGAFHVLRLPNEPFTQPAAVYRSAACVNPGSRFISAGLNDLVVQGDQVALCHLPDKGFLPVSCNAYPRPLPLTWQCIGGPGYYSVNAYGTATPYYTYPNGGTQNGYQQGNGTYQQGTGTYQPATGSYQPPAGTYQPPTGTYQPPTGTYQPATGTAQQGNVTQPAG